MFKALMIMLLSLGWGLQGEEGFRKLRFFNLDLHASVVQDLKYIFEGMGHEVVNWSLSGHSWLFGREKDEVEVVNGATWGELNESMCDRFYERYRDYLNQFDAFIVTHTPAFALLYAKFDKPILVVNSTRYEQPFTNDPNRWRWLDEYLKWGVENGRIFIVSNNKGDQHYLKSRTGIDSVHIPSLCLYTLAFYKGNKRGYIVHPFPHGGFRSQFKKELGSGWGLIGKIDSGYSWKTLYKYKGVIHFPYQISTMSLFEQYSANVPLFFPTKRFLLSLKEKYPDLILSQLTFYQVLNLQSPQVQGDMNNLNDPNVLKQWVDLADFYDEENMPYIQYFDSFKDLRKKLDKADLEKISYKMALHNAKRREKALASWKSILGQITAYCEAAP